MSKKPIVDTALQVPRLFKTAISAHRFSGTLDVPLSTPGQAQFNMRSTMDLDPRIGKALSKVCIRQADPRAWQVADIASSRYIDAAEVTSAVEGIRRDGFYVFQRTVASEITSAIRQFAERAPAIARGSSEPAASYPRQSPAVGRYDIEETVGLGCEEVQEFATDPVMALISQRYLGQPVIMDEVAFWWTTTQGSQDANLNAQMFHQDRDRLSFLKFFIYLTDVTPDTGPHVYLKGSHRRIPWSLRADGRIDDAAIRAAGLWKNVTELTGLAGTVMAVDTIGLHKGKTPTAGDRLALENEFSTSLFGNDYERPEFNPSSLVQQRFAAMPWVLQRYAASVSKH